MGSTLSSRLDAKEIRDLQRSTAFTKDELLELYAQFRFLSDDQKTITRAQFEAGLASTGITSTSSSTTTVIASDARPSGDYSAGMEIRVIGEDGHGQEFLRAPTVEDIATYSKVESLLYRLYDVMYVQSHDEPVPEDPKLDKGLSFDAFCAALSTFASPRPEEQVDVLFRLFDESGDDFINQDELYRALSAVTTLLELPELSTTTSDPAREVRQRIRRVSAEMIEAYGHDGKLTLPQFRDAMRNHRELGDVGRKLVTDACANFFHGPKPAVSPDRSPNRTPSSSGLTPPSTVPSQSVNSQHLSASGTVGREPSSPGMSRRGSFQQPPPDSPAYVFAAESDQIEKAGEAPAAHPPTVQPPLARCSLAHVIVHLHPRETLQQIAFIAQRHAAEFNHRPDDRFMHFVVLEHAKSDPVSPAALKELHKKLESACGGTADRRVHVALKPIALEDPSRGIDSDALESLIMRFLNANPSNVVRLPFHGCTSLHANVISQFDDLAVLSGHGFDLVTPETAPDANVRKMRNFIFCAERSKASERAARLIGTMMDPRFRDLCVVETIWSVSVSSIGHAYNDTDSSWQQHLASLRARSLKISEHFRLKVAHGMAHSLTARSRREAPSELDRKDPMVAEAFNQRYQDSLKHIATGAAEESEWDGRIARLLQRAGLLPKMSREKIARHHAAQSEVVIVLGFQSRTMAQKFYAATMSYLREALGDLELARTAVSIVVVN